MAALAEEHGMPAEQLLTPDYLRRTLWTPPRTRDPQSLAAAVAEHLAAYGARPWQVELTTPLLVAAILHGDEPVPDPDPEPGQAAPEA
jgi:ribonuclease D